LNKKKRPRVTSVAIITEFYTRAGDEYLSKNPVLSLTKKELDEQRENSKRVENRASKNQRRNNR
jgi:hypothetical protein